MLPAERKQQVFFILLQLLAFTIPLPFIFSSVCIILLLLSWLALAKVRQSLTYLKRRPALWPWPLFFLLHALSYFYSDDKGQSLFDIQRKLSFLILPLIVGTMPQLPATLLKKIMRAFVAGVTLAALICLGQATVIWTQQHTTDHFFYHELVRGFDTNAVYFAWYTLTALGFLLLVPWRLSRPLHRWGLMLVAVLLLVFLILLSSRLLLVLPAMAFRFRLQGRSWLGWLLAGGATIGLCLMLLIPNPIRNRFQDVLHNNSEQVWLPANPENQYFNNLTLRLFLWKMALENVKDHQLWWAGCGNGDVDSLQHEKINTYQHRLNRRNREDSQLWTYNLHNMYLQSLMMLGLGGLLLFLGIVLPPVFLSRRTAAPAALLVFSLASCCFMLQESALQTQAGIVFFTYFCQLCLASCYTARQDRLAPVVSLRSEYQ